MRFLTGQHQHYCGIDLHAATMYVCILNAAGEILAHRNVKSSSEALLEILAPDRDGLVVAAERTFPGYWLADLCAKESIPFLLGHALAMKALHGGKAKNDKIDSHKIAVLLRGGLLLQAYVYPAAMRATRDLLRRRLHAARKRIEVDLVLLARYDTLIADLELTIVRRAKRHDADAFHRLRSVPGIGKILALTLLDEIHDLTRFDRVQPFASYARLVKCAHAFAERLCPSPEPGDNGRTKVTSRPLEEDGTRARRSF